MMYVRAHPRVLFWSALVGMVLGTAMIVYVTIYHANLPSQISNPQELRPETRTTVLINCTYAPVDCHNHGVCNQDGTGCVCFGGYVTYQPPNNTQCNYEQKTQLGAFLFSFFLGYLGAGRLYVGDLTLGLIKLFVPMTLTVVSCILLCIGCSEGSGEGLIKECMFVITYSLVAISSMGVFCWWLVDVILFGLNAIPDGNGIGLKAW